MALTRRGVRRAREALADEYATRLRERRRALAERVAELEARDEVMICQFTKLAIRCDAAERRERELRVALHLSEAARKRAEDGEDAPDPLPAVLGAHQVTDGRAGR